MFDHFVKLALKGLMVSEVTNLLSGRRSFPGWENMILLFNFDVLSLLLKNNRGRNRRPNFISVVWNALNADGGGLRQRVLFRAG